MTSAIILKPDAAEFFIQVFADLVTVDAKGFAFIPCKSVTYAPSGCFVAQVAGRGTLHVPGIWAAAIWEGDSAKVSPGFLATVAAED